MGWNLKSDRPIYSQLIEQIELRIVSGLYPPGGKLPSVRELAADASVNPNTMQRALAELESQGLLFSQRTSGRFVTENEERIMSTKDALAIGLINEFLRQMNDLGYSREQTITLLKSMEEKN